MDLEDAFSFYNESEIAYKFSIGGLRYGKNREEG